MPENGNLAPENRLGQLFEECMRKPGAFVFSASHSSSWSVHQK
jgi:hypothetical protein